ncbi:hypothetical protein FSP39_022942 [Pinctada imbricata]|uniref:Tyr recombinase domain-containing protein n=1 Tax=Pinctada imbricata TaxID=66713 RepID=A0AA89BJN5_PINIB|nr:hypothetical protein FSP39_022942 [Pinctada imbricata]
MRWKKWAIQNSIQECLPARSLHVAIYLSCLVQQSKSPSPVIQAFYGIKWAHSVIRLKSRTDSDLVINVLEGAAKRRLSHSVQKKEPITPDLIDKMYDATFQEGNLYTQRTICACLLSYSGFLRVSELLSLKICDISFFTTHMSIFIEKSKTDIYRDGNCLRSGGASAAANFGIPDRLFKRHGRWKSETAKDGYIKDNLQERLSVSQNLGL